MFYQDEKTIKPHFYSLSSDPILEDSILFAKSTTTIERPTLTRFPSLVAVVVTIEGRQVMYIEYKGKLDDYAHMRYFLEQNVNAHLPAKTTPIHETFHFNHKNFPALCHIAKIP
jgi:hypothetical protein